MGTAFALSIAGFASAPRESRTSRMGRGWDTKMVSGSVAEMGTSMPVWSAYPRHEGLFDEMVELAKSPSSACTHITRTLLSMQPAKLLEVCSRAEIMFRRMGVTFNVYGEQRGVERIFPFDPIPRVIDAETWTDLEAGLIQRLRALNAFVGDVYGEGAIMNDGVIPRDLVLGCPQFRRAAVG